MTKTKTVLTLANGTKITFEEYADPRGKETVIDPQAKIHLTRVEQAIVEWEKWVDVELAKTRYGGEYRKYTCENFRAGREDGLASAAEYLLQVIDEAGMDIPQNTPGES